LTEGSRAIVVNRAFVAWDVIRMLVALLLQ
jgi:hypothetical protein